MFTLTALIGAESERRQGVALPQTAKPGALRDARLGCFSFLGFVFLGPSAARIDP